MILKVYASSKVQFNQFIAVPEICITVLVDSEKHMLYIHMKVCEQLKQGHGSIV